MPVIKVIEVIACSAKGINGAIKNLTAEVSRSIHPLDAASAKNIKVQVIEGQISSTAVVCRVSMWIDEDNEEK